jgi:hypothetical protein
LWRIDGLAGGLRGIKRIVWMIFDTRGERGMGKRRKVNRDPVGRTEYLRSLRGGAWQWADKASRSGMRRWEDVRHNSGCVGCRLLLVPNGVRQ